MPTALFSPAYGLNVACGAVSAGLGRQTPYRSRIYVWNHSEPFLRRMKVQTALPGPNEVSKHIGHEMKFLTFAAARFSDGAEYAVPLHDSALVRGRTLIDFFRPGPTDKSLRASMFYAAQSKPPALPTLAEDYFSFISGRISHVGRNRLDAFDQWPDRAPGQDKGDDRLERLARFVIELMRQRSPLLVAEYQSKLLLIASRCEEYLDDPTEARFHRMDPANLP